jgi:hypothetical protein
MRKMCMKKLVLATALSLGALVGHANADTTFTFGTVDLSLSAFAGVQDDFGSVTITPIVGGAHVVYDVAPNYVINNGGPHSPLAFNLTDVQNTSIVNIAYGLPPILTGVYSSGGDATQQPFGDFNSSIDSTCSPGNGGSGACHTSVLSFDILGFTSFYSTPFDTSGVPSLAGLNLGVVDTLFAGDIAYCPGGICTGGTGNVGGGVYPTPGPVVGAGLPGLAACAMFGLNSWRRRRNGTA